MYAVFTSSPRLNKGLREREGGGGGERERRVEGVGYRGREGEAKPRAIPLCVWLATTGACVAFEIC